MIKIKRLTIRAFRGFADEKTFEFGPVTILFGPNGSGKSSTLNAIEWCLFGKDSSGKDTGIRERIDWEISNRHAQKTPFVKIEFEDGKEVLRESLSKTKDNAQTEPIKHLLNRYSFKDFLVGVYQHQEVIRAILTREPKDRNEGFDRLFGLSEYRNIIQCLNDAVKDFKKETIGEGLTDIKNKIETKVGTITQLINNHKKELTQKGFTEDELSHLNESKYKEEILEEIKKVSERLNIDTSDRFKTLTCESKTDDFIRVVKEEIVKLKTKIPDIESHNKLVNEKTKLNQILIEYRNSRSNAKEKENNLRNFLEKNGKKEDLRGRIDKLFKEIEETERQKDQKNLHASVIEKAIQYLDKEGVGQNTCPVCGKETPNLLVHLKEEWQKRYKTQIEELSNHLSHLIEEKKRLQTLLETAERLEQDALKSKDEERKKIKEIENKLGKEIKEDEDPEVIIGKRLEEIQKNLLELSTTIEEKQRKLNEIEEKISNLSKIAEIQKLKDFCEKAREIEKTEEWQRISDTAERIKKFKSTIENIISAITDASKEEIKTTLENAQNKIDEYFRYVTQHPSLKSIIIEVSESKGPSVNNYEIKDSNQTSITPILSQGNLNVLALSLFFALSKNLPFGFIMMDDPSQSLGSDEKKRLVDILNEISEDKNIIISTMDAEFYESLRTGIKKQKRIYEFQRWTPENGPFVKEVF